MTISQILQHEKSGIVHMIHNLWELEKPFYPSVAQLEKVTIIYLHANMQIQKTEKEVHVCL